MRAWNHGGTAEPHQWQSHVKYAGGGQQRWPGVEPEPEPEHVDPVVVDSSDTFERERRDRPQAASLVHPKPPKLHRDAQRRAGKDAQRCASKVAQDRAEWTVQCMCAYLFFGLCLSLWSGSLWCFALTCFPIGIPLTMLVLLLIDHDKIYPKLPLSPDDLPGKQRRESGLIQIPMKFSTAPTGRTWDPTVSHVPPLYLHAESLLRITWAKKELYALNEFIDVEPVDNNEDLRHGYDSVYGMATSSSQLNYEEIVVYEEAAIKPYAIVRYRYIYYCRAPPSTRSLPTSHH